MGAITLAGFRSPGACWAPPPGLAVPPSLADHPNPHHGPSLQDLGVPPSLTPHPIP